MTVLPVVAFQTGLLIVQVFPSQSFLHSSSFFSLVSSFGLWYYQVQDHLNQPLITITRNEYKISTIIYNTISEKKKRPNSSENSDPVCLGGSNFVINIRHFRRHAYSGLS